MADLVALARDILTLALLALGSGLLLAGAIGLIRLPDLYNRIHAATKTTTIGLLTILLSGVLNEGLSPIGVKILAMMFFLALTVPVSGHLLARAGYRSGVPLAPQTLHDEYRKVHELLPPPGEAYAPDRTADDA